MADKWERLLQRRQQLQMEISRLEEDLRAIDRAIALVSSEPAPAAAPRAARAHGRRTGEGKPPIAEALRDLARASGGRIRIGEAARQLREMGISHAQHVENVVRETLRRSHEFRQVSRGVYELVETGGTPPQEEPAPAPVES
ncbi:DNA repair protein RecN [Candidatus Hydrogenisulfobacillus filiaventi]|uniref:DNA repair protein RecN n=1 Tax=Candidatus Hydrogenisulfobacillus filiaventi TaxID=2707344 RepID=A0A6F8ZD17_9FIRM|nr:DNA repair protein RecN [Candidatus Hydrogenisulfobacillus filiaventi]